MNSCKCIELMKLIDGIYIGSGTEIDVFGDCCCDHIVGC